jgi:spore maturation protein CgeB
VLAVSSFHISSTRDVWRKAISGLRANGVDVVPFDVAGRYALFQFLHDKMERSKRNLPRDWAPTTLAYEALLGAAVYHDCDWVLVTSPQYFPAEIALMMQTVGIKTAALFTECPYEDTIHTPLTASAFNVAFVNDLHSVGLFQSFCPFVEYIPHSYDPVLHYPPEVDERDENIVFIGTGYASRVQLLKQVEWPARLDLYGWWPKEWLRYDTALRKAVRKVSDVVVDGSVEVLRTGSSVTTPEETAAIYRKSAVSFSIHREMRYVGSDDAIMDGEAYSLGPRNWELAACRTFQVSDYRQELVDVFADTVPMYESAGDLSRLLARAFDDPAWRIELAYRQWEKALPYSCVNTMKTAAQVMAAA